MSCSAVLLAVPLERALRRKAMQETREQDLGKEAPVTLQGRRGSAGGACFLFRTKLQKCLSGDLSGRPPAMPVIGPHRTTGIAAFLGAPGSPPLVYSGCPSLLRQKHLAPLASFMFLTWFYF